MGPRDDASISQEAVSPGEAPRCFQSVSSVDKPCDNGTMKETSKTACYHITCCGDTCQRLNVDEADLDRQIEEHAAKLEEEYRRKTDARQQFMDDWCW